MKIPQFKNIRHKKKPPWCENELMIKIAAAVKVIMTTEHDFKIRLNM